MKEYYKTTNSVSYIMYHLVFCPRYRRQIFTNSETCEAFANEVKGIFKDIDMIKHEIIFGADYVYLIIQAPPKLSPHEIVGKIKNQTSKALREQFEDIHHLDTLWTRNYFVSTEDNLAPEIIENFVNAQKTRG